MALTTAQQVRLRIQDAPYVFDHVGTADGMASAYALLPRNITSGTAYVADTGGQWSATGATINPTGYVTFSGMISANTGWRVRGVASTFSDEEIGYFTAVGGTVDGAAFQAVEVLMFDSLKRAKWAAPDGTQYDDTQAQEQLRDMWTALRVQLDDAGLSDGGFASWPMGQTGL